MDNTQKLTEEKIIEIRFSEVDSMSIVWHGSYVKYFEDAREAFGKKYNLGYLRIFGEGYYAPLVKLDFNFKRSLVYGDKAIVRITYIPTEAAKICFEYSIVSFESKEIMVTGNSTQVFLNKEYKLELTNPAFYEQWKHEQNV